MASKSVYAYARAGLLATLVAMVLSWVAVDPVPGVWADGETCRELLRKESITESERPTVQQCLVIANRYAAQVEGEPLPEAALIWLRRIVIFGHPDGTFAASSCYADLATSEMEGKSHEVISLICLQGATVWAMASSDPVWETLVSGNTESQGAAGDTPGGGAATQDTLGSHWSNFCEKNSLGEFCGELTRNADGSSWDARWANGARASFTVTLDGRNVTLERKPDTAGPSQGLKATYHGEIKEGTISGGTVRWSGTGSPVVGQEGSWKASIDP